MGGPQQNIHSQHSQIGGNINIGRVSPSFSNNNLKNPSNKSPNQQQQQQPNFIQNQENLPNRNQYLQTDPDEMMANFRSPRIGGAGP